MGASEPIVTNVLTENLTAVANEQRSFSSDFFQKAVTFAEILADFVTSAAGICIAYYLYFSLQIGKHVHYPMREVTVIASVVGMLIVLLLERDGAYRGGRTPACSGFVRPNEPLGVPWQAPAWASSAHYILSRANLLAGCIDPRSHHCADFASYPKAPHFFYDSNPARKRLRCPTGGHLRCRIYRKAGSVSSTALS